MPSPSPLKSASRWRQLHAATLAVLAFASALVATPAHAYRTSADLEGFDGQVATWPGGRVAIGFESELAIDQQALERAVATWAAVSCATLRFELAASRPQVAVEWVDDWSARGLEDSAAGTTDLNYLSNDDEMQWRIAGATIFLNRALIESRGLDLQSVLTHELGHVLGLLHPCEPGEADAPCTPVDEGSALFPEHRMSQVMLSEDDVAGVCFLYPAECEGPDCPSMCTMGDGFIGDECAWLGDPCDATRACAMGECASDGYCSMACTTTRECGTREQCNGGLCIPTVTGRYGATCTRGEDCQSLLCVTTFDLSTCTRACDTTCPEGDECAEVDGRLVCRPPLASGGCSASLLRRPSNAFPFLLFAFLFARVRRRSQRAAKPRGATSPSATSATPAIANPRNVTPLN